MSSARVDSYRALTVLGFVGGHFVVTDIGTHDVLQADSTRDAEMHRPIPLQILATAAGYRLCLGRNCVEFRRAGR